MSASQARSGSAHRHSAGQRAAALCLSPGNSKDTANEGAAHSTGGGSLQTIIEGDQDHKDKAHAAAVHGGGERHSVLCAQAIFCEYEVFPFSAMSCKYCCDDRNC